MAAIIKVVPEEDMRILEKYLVGGGVVLIPEAVAKQLPEIIDGVAVDYDFGGDPDIRVDVVRKDNHHFLRYNWDNKSDI